MEKFVYLDNAATTKISEEVLKEMLPFLQESYGNASTIYSIGRESRSAIEKARKQVASAIGCLPQEVFFTSGGTESDNWAIQGTARRLARNGKNHIITTNIEHHAVLHTCEMLEKQGFEVTYLKVDSEGFISAKQVEEAIKDTTCLVTVMYANNEIGTIQPIKDIGKICRDKGVWFHTDAVQALSNVDVNVVEQNIDLMSISSHKIHGPKGVGVLYIKRGIVLDNIITGGGQERAKRPGTENVSGIVGFGYAITEAMRDMDEKVKNINILKSHLIESVLKIPFSSINGSLENRLCFNINFSFGSIEGESLLLMLDLKGICASSGSACTSGSLDPSHVLLALGKSHEVAHGSLRISLGKYTTKQEIDYLIEVLPPIVDRLREISPLWKN